MFLTRIGFKLLSVILYSIISKHFSHIICCCSTLFFVLFLFFSALVEEIFAAQKEHDEAILARMNLANDERDDALNRAKRMEDRDGFDSGTDVNSNDDYSHTDAVSKEYTELTTMAYCLFFVLLPLDL